ncbi:hypothetical protein HZC34_08110 [Candidatus Saganbacteria bacterium]|nr:hypothetical protein [Candidatus Saganbacteria bacterium]
MKKVKKLNKLLFYFKKLPPIKQSEVMDYIKWLWVSPDEEFTGDEWKKIEKLSKQKGKTFDTWDKAKAYLDLLKK